MPDERPADHITRREIVLSVKNANRVVVKSDVPIPTADGLMAADVYYPPDTGEDGRLLPVVVLVSGYPDEGLRRMVGCLFKDMGSSISWARAIAASGVVALTYVNRDPVTSLNSLLAALNTGSSSLGIDGNRIGLWASSGNVPVALGRLQKSSAHPVRALAGCYGYLMDLDGDTRVADAARQFRFQTPLEGVGLDAIATDVPLFLARAGGDEMPGLNSSMDRFIERALARNLPIDLVNHPEGPHAFDLVDDGEMSRHVIRQVLSFLSSVFSVSLVSVVSFVFPSGWS